ncbi:MAG: serine phosphatase RsbU (regulator of sigma subunit) [Oceanicoccus sp.]|jgi:serine phosphatase RsbU (regulator of sigma subunit)
MSPIRRSIFASVFLWILISGLISYGVAFATSFVTENLVIQLVAGIATLNILTLLIIYTKVTHPIRSIILEMKALLTGKNYRRIMTKRQDEVGILAHFFNEVTRNMENISTDMRQHQALVKEVNTAQAIQRDLLPTELPTVPGLDLAAKTRPASEIGGDAYNFYNRDGRYFMYIGDSTGHGIPAGLIMIMVDVLMDTFTEIADTLLDMITQINRFLKPNLRPTMFMSLILLEWIPERNTFKWVGAGHEYLIHVRPSTDTVTRIPAGGIALGMIDDNRPLSKEQELTLEKGDFLVLYTDGINEAKNVTGEIYGLERLEELLRLHTRGETTANELFEKVAVDVSRFMEGHKQDDDMTLLVFKSLNAVGNLVTNEVQQDKALA